MDRPGTPLGHESRDCGERGRPIGQACGFRRAGRDSAVTARRCAVWRGPPSLKCNEVAIKPALAMQRGAWLLQHGCICAWGSASIGGMLLNAHDHGHACDCAAHRAPSQSAHDASLWSAILPALACAICPACLTTYAKLLSVLGVGVGLTEFHHLMLLVVAIGASIGVSAWRSWRTRRAWPLVIAATGSALVIIGHAGDLHAVEWAGVLLLLVGGLTEHFRLRRWRERLVRSAA